MFLFCCRIAKEFGTLFSYSNEYNVPYEPSNGPPGSEALFYPGATEDPLSSDMSMQRFLSEAPLVANRDYLEDPNYDVIFQVNAK